MTLTSLRAGFSLASQLRPDPTVIAHFLEVGALPGDMQYLDNQFSLLGRLQGSRGGYWLQAEALQQAINLGCGCLHVAVLHMTGRGCVDGVGCRLAAAIGSCAGSVLSSKVSAYCHCNLSQGQAGEVLVDCLHCCCVLRQAGCPGRERRQRRQRRRRAAGCSPGLASRGAHSISCARFRASQQRCEACRTRQGLPAARHARDLLPSLNPSCTVSCFPASMPSLYPLFQNSLRRVAHSRWRWPRSCSSSPHNSSSDACAIGAISKRR